jgi:hypothetical protein
MYLTVLSPAQILAVLRFRLISDGREASAQTGENNELCHFRILPLFAFYYFVAAGNFLLYNFK